jgi:hypothetical protein
MLCHTQSSHSSGGEAPGCCSATGKYSLASRVPCLFRATVMDPKQERESPEPDKLTQPAAHPLPSASASRSRWLVLAIACALAASLTLFRPFGTFSSTGETTLPGTYAVCSATKDIWTVDEATPRVRCIGVHAGYIISAGELGIYAPQTVDTPAHLEKSCR